ncbi:energy-coupling factor ABC transporter permease [Serpentinicella sp. ANB-PHB4]|uniref:energy-coupling factor ABC transporter permease n=1 Tax=Serpentinicella sp. ANB-PHB4 TaxID=3074076 RepID=UPI00285E0B61|nr:energy-coupling factor ABC transporter permease [Serpentinicella sp. ANB-PHB4]MDR5658630.1 energy-coupling factor ABC transporter permease [Serpentinicella sp. ANB-PHB4]
MSHIHIPDGILNYNLWIGALLITFAILFIILRTINKDEVMHKIPYTGVAAAIMLLGMSVPLVIVPVHLSLAVLTGILVGPKLGFIAVFIVNVILALFGHGGITLIGLNTLIIGSEVLIGYSIFKLLAKKGRYIMGTMVATVVAVIISMSLMVGVVATTGHLSEALPHSCGHDHGEEQILDESNEVNVYDHHHDFHEELEDVHYLAFTGWTAVGLIFAAGLLLESIGTTLIVKYFMKVRPGLISAVETQQNT